MANSLVIVESPGKVKTISKILGQGYTVRPTVGHIIDLAKGRGGDIGVNIQAGFVPKYEVLADKKDVIKAIIDAAKSADQIFVASDADREGEAISFHVLSQLKDIDKPIKRIDFNEITKKAITYAIEHPREFNKNLFDAQQARRVIDRIVGFMVSPYLSKKLLDTLSAGRVQSVALRLIVDREREIESFIPEVYYNINATLAKKGDSNKFIAKYPQRIEQEEEANNIKNDLNISSYKVLDIQTKDNIRKTPAPLITSTLQQEASTKLKFKADRTMKAAQELYEAGLVTYIRTDSVHNSIESITAAREYLTKNGYKIPKVHNEFANKDQAQNAHEAIRPTDINTHPDKVVLEGDKQKIYKLIWCMFLSSQMNPAIFDVVKITILASKGHKLLSEGKILRDSGWMSIAKPFIKQDKDVILPPLSVGDVVDLVTPKVKLEKSQTKSPSRYGDASLIAELERKEIGRPSTYASILTKIATRKYVKETPKGFFPTDLGKTVVDDLKELFSFMDYTYTADMEKNLDKIADGKSDYLSVMTEFFDKFKVEFQKARGLQGMSTGFPCPKCGDDTVVRKSQFGFFAACMKYKSGCDGIINISIEDGKIYKKGREEKIDNNITCPECNAGMVYRPDGRFGPFYSCSNYPRCKGKRKIPFGKKCSKCGGELYATLFSGKLKLACMEYPKCKNIENLPDGAKVDWLNPEQVTPPTYHKKVEKLLK
ncbi:MAG: type I DNA topoisomerase [Clostridia bacterium]|jgi:DNA topoisomerase-1